MESPTERLAPHNLEAERAVLGSVMLESSLFNQAAQILRGDDFYLASHRKIYSAFSHISETSASGAIDLVTLREVLLRFGNFEDVGGNAYLSSLIDGLPRYSNIEHYARIVKEKSVLRNLINAGTKIINDCFTAEDDTRNILERAQSSVFKIADQGYSGSGFRPVEELTAPALEKLAKMVNSRSGITGLSTGFFEFDEITAGLQKSDLIIIAARPSMGKTSMALNISQHAAREGKIVGLFSLEMDIEQLFIRMVCTEARINSHRIRSGRLSDEDFKRLAPKIDEFMNFRIFIDDTPALGVMEARAKARRLKAEHGLDLLIIDYLQLMNPQGRSENRNLEIGQITRGLKALAKELAIPVVVLSQLSRAPDNRSDHRPQLSDLRESGNIEQDADLVCFLYREEFYSKDQEKAGLAELIIGKNRNGPVGTVNLVFIADYTKFENYIRPEEIDEEH